MPKFCHPKCVHDWVEVVQVFSAKLVLEVFGGAGAIWGFSETVGLRTAATAWFWRPAALTVGAIFFLRWMAQLRDYEISHPKHHHHHHHKHSPPPTPPMPHHKHRTPSPQKHRSGPPGSRLSPRGDVEMPETEAVKLLFADTSEDGIDELSERPRTPSSYGGTEERTP